MKVSFYLARPESLTETAIFCRISYSGYKLKYFTPEGIIPKYWNNAKGKPHRAKETSKFPEHPEFNRRLDNIETAIKNTIRTYINDNQGTIPTPKYIKPLIDAAVFNGAKRGRVTFLEFFDDYIAQCKSGKITHKDTDKPLKPGTIKNYETTLFNIRRYITDTRAKVDFDTIDIDFYKSFTAYLTKKKQSVNTVGKYFSLIKPVLKAAKKIGLIKNTDYEDFRVHSVDADTIYLTESELKGIAAVDFTKIPRLDTIRDLFLVGCYTGLRFSDLSTLRPDQISGDMISITQIKTGKPVVIPLHDAVKDILTKYGGQLPTSVSNQKTNNYIKEVCREVEALKIMIGVTGASAVKIKADSAPKCELVSTHTARRSFATNEYLAGTPALTIMAITGHKTEKAFLRYIRVTPDEHAKILQKIWTERKSAPVKAIAL